MLVTEPWPVFSATAGVAHTDVEAGAAFVDHAERYPGRSGIFPLRDALDAFAARMLMAESARRTLDVQYYIWRDDLTGMLMFDALRAAAERGVRVRLLLDDNNGIALDPYLCALDAHANIQVRLFNPFFYRHPKAFGYLTDFRRLNRRMHNKSMTADGEVSIIGGRNIGDEYFGATDDVLFADMDVVGAGPVAARVGEAFEQYWCSASAYPVSQVLRQNRGTDLSAVWAKARSVEQKPAAEAFIRRVRESVFLRRIFSGHLELSWVPVEMVCDDAAKGLGLEAPEALLTHQLRRAVGQPRQEVLLVSPYFVPTSTGVAEFVELARNGVDIRVLTNSLEANDVPAVHAGYAKRRKGLLRAGVRLFELKRVSSLPRKKRWRRHFRRPGSSGSSLHAKTFAIDRSRVFIGSFNFDPRSAALNTELGFLIEDADLAARVAGVFDDEVAYTAYEVRLDERGRIYWLEQVADDRLVRHDSEPGARWWQRATVAIVSRLPVEWLL